MSDPLGHTRRTRLGLILAVAPAAVLSTVLAAAREARTPMWRDEYATGLYASLDLAALRDAVSHVDLVFGPYYALMHLLSGALGTDVGMRTPSLIAYVGTAVTIAYLAWRWWGALAGALAGLAWTVSEMALAGGVAARPYAVSTFVFVGAVVILNHAITCRSRWPWVGFAAATLLAVALQPLAVLAAAATGVLLIERTRSALRRWSLCMAPAVLVGLGTLFLARGQAGQVSWIGEVNLRGAIGTMAFVSGFSPQRSIILDAAVLTALAACSAYAAYMWRGRRREIGFSLALFAGPAVILIFASLLITPMFIARYLSWSSVGAALTVGAVAGVLQHVRTPVTIAGAIVAASLIIAGWIPTAGRVTQPAPRADNFPAVVAGIAANAEPGDLLLVMQRYSEGGVAWGFADASGDDAYKSQILDDVPAGPLPVLDLRSIDSVDPLRSTRVDASSSAGPGRRLWIVGIGKLDDSVDLGGIPADVAACLVALDNTDPAAFDAGVYSVPCPPT